MKHEIETKILNIDVEKIKKHLVKLGVQKLQETRLAVNWYRTKGTKEGEDIVQGLVQG